MSIPPYTQIAYSANGTPSRIQAENLTAALVSHHGFQSALKAHDHREMAFLLLTRYQDFLKLTHPRQELRIDKLKKDRLGNTHIHLQQMFDKIPVWGKTIQIHFNQKDAVYLFQGNYLPSTVLKSTRTSNGITAQKAAAKALAAASSDNSMQWAARDKAEIIFVTESGRPRLAYGITLTSGPVHRSLYFIDAENGRVLHKTQLTRNSQKQFQASELK